MHQERFFRNLILCVFPVALASCASKSVDLKSCQPLEDTGVQSRLLEVVRPYVEHEYPSHKITLEDQISMGVPEFYNCGATYQVLFTTRRPNGELSVGGEQQYQIDKDTMGVTNVWYFGM